jgi:hypothetical protein
MEKLGIFKVMEDERLELCGFYNTKEEAIQYLEYVQNEIARNMQHQYEGEYVVIPMLHYDLKRTNPSK